MRAFFNCVNLALVLACPMMSSALSTDPVPGGIYTLNGQVLDPYAVTPLRELGLDDSRVLVEIDRVVIPSGVKTMEVPFGGCTNLAGIFIDQANPYFCFKDGLLMNRDQTVLLECLPGKNGPVVLPESILEIGHYAFAGCTRITSVSLPLGITRVGFRAFQDCTGLRELKFSSSLQSIGDEAFSGCSMLENIYVRGGSPHIGEDVNLDSPAIIRCILEEDDWSF